MTLFVGSDHVMCLWCTPESLDAYIGVSMFDIPFSFATVFYSSFCSFFFHTRHFIHTMATPLPPIPESYYENFLESLAQIVSKLLTDKETETVLASIRSFQDKLKRLSRWARLWVVSHHVYKLVLYSHDHGTAKTWFVYSLKLLQSRNKTVVTTIASMKARRVRKTVYEDSLKHLLLDLASSTWLDYCH